jgi:transposase InsO family protein
VRYGMWRIYILLRREGFKDNHKRAHRIYKEEGLNLRSKRPRRNKAAAHRLERPERSSLHQCWSMDFVQDQLFAGRKFRCLTVMDNFSRYCHAIRVGKNFRPHSSLNDQTPADVVKQYQSIENPNNKKSCLPAAPVWEAMYFAAEKYPSEIYTFRNRF